MQVTELVHFKNIVSYICIYIYIYIYHLGCSRVLWNYNKGTRLVVLDSTQTLKGQTDSRY